MTNYKKVQKLNCSKNILLVKTKTIKQTKDLY